MLVDVNTQDHWKTVKLGILLGTINLPSHISVLLRLWGYCQVKRTCKLHVTEDELADICRWFGDSELLVSSLISSKFIEKKDGYFEVMNWEKHNKKLVQCWENGMKGGRPKVIGNTTQEEKPKNNRKKPNANRKQTNLDIDLELEEKENIPTGYKRKSASALSGREFFLTEWESEASADLRASADAESLKQACLDFIEHRDTMRPAAKMTRITVRRMLVHLRSVSPKVAIAMIADAIDRGHRAWYFEDKAERFSAKLDGGIGSSGGNGGGFEWNPRDPGLDDDGPDPWKI